MPRQSESHGVISSGAVITASGPSLSIRRWEKEESVIYSFIRSFVHQGAEVGGAGERVAAGHYEVQAGGRVLQMRGRRYARGNRIAGTDRVEHADVFAVYFVRQPLTRQRMRTGGLHGLADLQVEVLKQIDVVAVVGGIGDRDMERDVQLHGVVRGVEVIGERFENGRQCVDVGFSPAHGS